MKRYILLKRVMRFIISAFAFLTMLITFQINADACTIFSKSDEDTSLMGNSEDYNKQGFMTVTTSSEGNFGMITFSFADNYVQGGINEYGLAIDGTGAINEMPMVSDSEKTTFEDNIIEELLKKCKNVDEVINLCDQYNLPVLKIAHIMVADALGNSVIIELGKDGYTEYLTKEGNWQVLTNFNISNPSIGYYPCDRFEKASEMLPVIKPEIWDTVKVLDAVKTAGTKYSQIYDCKNKTFHLFLNGNYKMALVFDVEKMLENGNNKYRLKKLFKMYNVMGSIDGPTTKTSKLFFSAPESIYQLKADNNNNDKQIILPVKSADNVNNFYMYYFISIVLSIVIFLCIVRVLRAIKNKKKKTMIMSLLLSVSLSMVMIWTFDIFKNDYVTCSYSISFETIPPGKWSWYICEQTELPFALNTAPSVVTVD